jgi:AraC-like DNA-binding protein
MSTMVASPIMYLIGSQGWNHLHHGPGADAETVEGPLHLLPVAAVDVEANTAWCGWGLRLITLRADALSTTWTAPAVTRSWGLTLARRGAYRRRVDGLEHIVDASTGFVQAPGQVVSTATSWTGVKELTTIEVRAATVEHLPGLRDGPGPIEVEPPVALSHRLLLRQIALDLDSLSIESAVLRLILRCVRPAASAGAIGRRSSTVAHRRKLVTDVLEVLNSSLSEPLGLLDLAQEVGSSPYHLSRVFRQVTGTTVSQYRTRLRVHAVVDRLDRGDHDLSAIAAATGFADHGHMTRAVRRHLGAAPSTIRQVLLEPRT